MAIVVRDRQEFTKVIIDSAKRNITSISSTNMTINLNRAVDRVKKIQLVSMQVPFTYYAINSTNNKIKLDIFGASVAVVPGNYNSTTFPVALKTALDTGGAGAPFTVTYSSLTHKLTISSAAAFVVQTTGVADNIASILGFTVDNVASTSVTADGILNIHGSNFLVLKSNVLTQYASNPCATDAKTDGRTILHTVSTTGNPSDIIIDMPIFSIIELNTKRTFQNNIDFILEDSNGNVLDLNGGEWSATFLFLIE